jgi:transposase
LPDPWRSNIDISLQVIDDLDQRINDLTAQIKRQGADHRYIPTLVTAPGVGWINAFTIASEIGDITRFASPSKLCGYTGLCPRVRQSGAVDARGPISKHGPKYLRWALFEAALSACKHPYYRDRYQHTKRRLGRQRGPKVAQIDLARRLTESIWHMLTLTAVARGLAQAYLDVLLAPSVRGDTSTPYFDYFVTPRTGAIEF